MLRLLAACFALSLAGCRTAPGRGHQARGGYQAAGPVIAALEKFHEAHGHYPAALSELAPGYLPAPESLLVRGKVVSARSPRDAATTAPRSASTLDEFRYVREEDGYQLSFSYAGPGMNNCVYESKTRKWRASGYY